MKQKNKKKYTPKDDIIFKLLFGAEGKESRLKDLLEAIINKPIKNLVLGKDTHLLPEEVGRKAGVLDIFTILEDGTKINIELQTAQQSGFKQRLNFYMCKLYLRYVNKGTKYKDIPKSIVIFILDYVEFKNVPDYHLVFKMTEQKYKQEVIEGQEIHIIELPKFRNARPDLKDKLDQWLYFIDYKDKGMVDMAVKVNEEVRGASKEFKKIISKERREYLEFLKDKWRRDTMAREDFLLEQGEKRGIKKGQIVTARNMIKLDFEIDMIMKATGLSLKDVEKLKSEF